MKKNPIDITAHGQSCGAYFVFLISGEERRYHHSPIQFNPVRATFFSLPPSPLSMHWLQWYCTLILSHMWSHGDFCHDSLHFSFTLGPTEGHGRVYIIVIFLVVPHTLTTARGCLHIGFSLIHQPLISHLYAEAHHI